MGSLVFVGLGLWNEKGISLRGLEEARKADLIYIDSYTSYFEPKTVEKLSKLIGKMVKPLSRHDLEEGVEDMVIEKAKDQDIVILVSGDPMIATTHVDLRLRATQLGIKTKLIHGTSVQTAAFSLVGLMNYKSGQSVTIPFPEGEYWSVTPYDVIAENIARGLHTLVYLDIKSNEKGYMTIKDAIHILIEIEKQKKQKIITPDRLVVGLERLGSSSSKAIAFRINQVENIQFGPIPHIMIIPGQLHFIEAEALILLANAPKNITNQNHLERGK